MRVLFWGFIVFVLVVLGIPLLMVYSDISLRSDEMAGQATPDVAIDVFVESKGGVQAMPLEEYLKGVVAAEMPASFHEEALKAQAVVARTYAVRRMRIFGGPGSKEHPGADISTDPVLGQAWISKKECRQKWGLFGYLRYWPKIEAAVRETEGLVIVHRNRLIDPVYHSTCGGHTENSEDVWSGQEPYLRGKPCPYDIDSPHYGTVRDISYEEMAARLGLDALALKTVRGNRDAFIQILKTGRGGHASVVRVGDKEMSANEFRLALGLRSSKFTWRLLPDGVRFVTDGYGHGVGLCQYGADGMARRGYKFEEIIKYYYTGVQVVPMFRE